MENATERRWIPAARFVLDLIEKHLPALLLAGIVLVFLLQVVCRYFFRSLAWPEEMVGFFFLWLVCFGTGYAEREERLIRFEMIHSAVSPTATRIMDIVGHIILTSALCALVVPSIQYISYMSFRSSYVLPIKMSVVYAPFLVLLAALICRYSARIWEDVSALRRGPPVGRRQPRPGSDSVNEQDLTL